MQSQTITQVIKVIITVSYTYKKGYLTTIHRSGGD